MVNVVLAKKEDECILERLMQKYLYEMSLYYGTRIGNDGNYDYPYLKYYFTDSDRQAFLIYRDDSLAGFALVNTHSFTEEKADNCLAEFNIFPVYRRNGCGTEAIEELLKIRKGKWQLKYSPKNTAGAGFWRKIGRKYNGTEKKADSDEIVLSFSV